ncbi:leucine-rich repeat domain-containing protein [Prevotella sp.]|uniref:leucine-rich repeat domain-containing protein n=1 Tax=Prevotella sp. TaxID=59823 RepID=UPI0027E31A86|nr:leucine-rich repeat domain-containing protein [Prevotella sp.]
MRNFTFKGLFLTAVFTLLGCLSIQAADDDLITKQITIKLDEAGTLPDRIGASKKYLITNLKIIGKINGTDWKMIREMVGRDYENNKTAGKLSMLDLSEAKIVKGGDRYFSGYFSGYYSGDNCYTSNDEIGECAFKDCSRLTSLTLPAGITSIGYAAFNGCHGLTSLTLPAGITSIGRSAFCGCSRLTSLTLPAGITSIGRSTFEGCRGLTSLTLPAGITSIGGGAFKDCSGLTSLTLPAGITSINYGTFYGCSGLTSLNLPAGITSIDYNAFYGCSGLTSLTLPAGITSIGEYAFRGCSGLTSIYVYSEKVPKMGTDVFKGCDANKCTVYVPKGTYDDYWISEFGYFENIVEFDPTGIDKTTTSTDVEEVSRYSLNGQRLVGPTKGLNIVKYSDGSVKKVAVE